MIAKDVLDRAQGRLHDAGTIWPRTELLRWLNDGYRALLAQSLAVKRLSLQDVPGRFASTFTFEWESRFAPAPSWRWSVPCSDGSFATSFWEAEFLEGVTPTASRAGVTQLWERTILSEDIEASFRFALPRDHERIKRVAWDDRRLTAAGVKSLDELQTAWFREPGEPIVWNAGTGRNRSFEIYEVRTDYQQGYDLRDVSRGTPRQFSGDRTWGRDVQDVVSNGVAYSSPADAEILTGLISRFEPTSAYTADFEKDFVDWGGYRFTFYSATDSPDQPSIELLGTQPWEVGINASGAQYGTFPWEAVHGGELRRFPNHESDFPGPARRFTTVTSSPSYFTTQPWEVIDSAGNFSADTVTGSVVGTFSWESEFGATAVTLPLGVVRGVDSPDRQYLAVPLGVGGLCLGIPRDFRTSKSAVTVTEAILPAHDLAEQDKFDLIPSQMVKYLRYYVLSQAFGRQGEGRNAKLASHYERRFLRGVMFFKKLADVAHRDRVWARQEYAPEPTRPPRVRLPSEFPQVRY